MQIHYQCFHISAVLFQQLPHMCTQFYTHLSLNDSIRHPWVTMFALAEFMAEVLTHMSMELLCFLFKKKCCRTSSWHSYVVGEIYYALEMRHLSFPVVCWKASDISCSCTSLLSNVCHFMMVCGVVHTCYL
jgi:hypothetical protein